MKPSFPLIYILSSILAYVNSKPFIITPILVFLCYKSGEDSVYRGCNKQRRVFLTFQLSNFPQCGSLESLESLENIPNFPNLFRGLKRQSL